MDLLRRVSRPMLASIFITGGIDTLRNPAKPASVAGDVATDLAEAAPVDLPDDPESLIKIDAGVKIAGGLLLASGGRLARIGALACAASLIPTTWAAHRFWEVDDPEARAQQQVHFFKNLSLLGGLLIAAADTGGRPSIPWRAGHAAHEIKDKAADLLPVG
jgi:putative oxidoreductase